MGMIYAPPSIIPNGALINGVCHIYQSTKPTTRPNGSALVIGDKWYNISTGVEGFWNGTYWLSLSVYYEVASATPGTYSNFSVTLARTPIFISNSNIGIFVRSFNISGRTTMVNDSSNYHQISLFTHNSGGQTLLGSLNTIGLTDYFSVSLIVNTAYLPSLSNNPGVIYLFASQSVVGTPGNLGVPASYISYNLIL